MLIYRSIFVKPVVTESSLSFGLIQFGLTMMLFGNTSLKGYL